MINAKIDKNKDPEELLKTRNLTHGDFHQQFACAQEIKALFAKYENYNYMNLVQRECMDQIAHKLSRILTGDVLFYDHWKDIAGYAALGEKIANEKTDLNINNFKDCTFK